MRTKISSVLAGMGLMTSLSLHAQAIIGPELTKQLGDNQLTSLAGPSAIKVIVSFKQGNQAHSVMQALGIPYLALQELPMVGATLTPDMISQLQQNPAVESIYFDAPLRYYNYNSGEITGGHYVHDNYQFTGKGGVVAVLDSGVDATHPDLTLGEKTIQNVKLINDLDLAGGLSANLEGIPNTDTSSGHGTHVAGTVGGTGAMSENDERRAFAEAGIAPDSKLVGISAGEAISILHALKGFDYALANHEKYGIDVITNSWGSGAGSDFDPNNPINRASFEAYERGMVVTFAAGNDGPGDNTLNVYGVAPWVIDVAAGTPDRHLADFSSRGVPGDEIKTPDITAPGSTIYSTRAVNTPLPALGPVIDFNNPEYHVYYATMSGTSMATPFVAGAVTVILEANPDLSPDQVDAIIKESADDMYDASGRQYLPHEVGAGHINVKKAVELALVTEGKAQEFMLGDTKYASDGSWNQGDNTDALVNYAGHWSEMQSGDAFGGSVTQANGAGNVAYAGFRGDRIKVHFGAAKGGAAKILVDGKKVKTVSLHGDSGEDISVSINGLSDDSHVIEIRTLSGQVAFDRFEIDGVLTEDTVIYNTISMDPIEGTMGPSASADAGGLGVDPAYTINEHRVMVSDKTVGLKAVLSWEPFADLDFAIADADGTELTGSATLDNPEVIQLDVTEGGEYVFKVKGYTSALANYSIAWEVVEAN